MDALQDFVRTTFPTLGLIAFIAILALIGLRIAIPIYQRRLEVLGLASLLQGAAWSLVRHMENNPRHTAGKNRRSQEQMFHANIVAAADRFRLPNVPAVYEGELFPAFMANKGQELVEFNRVDADKFWFKVQGLRNGLQVFLDIMVLGNVTAAYIKMIDHMRRQRDEYDGKGKKSSPNLTELKRVFNLPTAWPTGDMPERMEERGLTELQAENIALAARRYRQMILAKLHYKIWPEPGKEEEERRDYHGENLLLAMRDYVR